MPFSFTLPVKLKETPHSSSAANRAKRKYNPGFGSISFMSNRVFGITAAEAKSRRVFHVNIIINSHEDLGQQLTLRLHDDDGNVEGG